VKKCAGLRGSGTFISKRGGEKVDVKNRNIFFFDLELGELNRERRLSERNASCKRAVIGLKDVGSQIKTDLGLLVGSRAG